MVVTPKRVEAGKPNQIACPVCGTLIPLKVRRKSGMVRGAHGNVSIRQPQRQRA
jgi:DNA-directed RNA polymerase subunit RPC12/RpoP